MHIIVTSICAGTVEVTDYNLDFKECSGSHKVLNDPNECVKNSVLVPQGRTALLFEIESAGGGSEKKKSVVVRLYSLLATNSSQITPTRKPSH